LYRCFVEIIREFFGDYLGIAGLQAGEL
jgi:hypothetical protein